MTRITVDAYAWIEYLEGSEQGKKVALILEDSSNDIFTSSSTMAEVLSKFLRENRNLEIALTAMNNLSSIASITPEIGILAGHLHFEAKKKHKDFGMLDAFVVATARTMNAKILTGDKRFRGFKEAVFIRRKIFYQRKKLGY